MKCVSRVRESIFLSSRNDFEFPYGPRMEGTLEGTMGVGSELVVRLKVLRRATFVSSVHTVRVGVAHCTPEEEEADY